MVALLLGFKDMVRHGSGFFTMGAIAAAFGQSSSGKPLLIELVWVPILIPV